MLWTRASARAPRRSRRWQANGGRSLSLSRSCQLLRLDWTAQVRPSRTDCAPRVSLTQLAALATGPLALVRPSRSPFDERTPRSLS